MKIRTDFVTNSSSSSFVTMFITMDDDRRHVVELDFGNSGFTMYSHMWEKLYTEPMKNVADLKAILNEFSFDAFDADPDMVEKIDSLFIEESIGSVKSVIIREDGYDSDGPNRSFRRALFAKNPQEVRRMITEWKQVFKIGEFRKEDHSHTWNAQISEYKGQEHDVFIPGIADYYAVIKIADNAFRGNALMENVTIGEGVQEIGARAFADCPNLKTVHLPKSIKSIGNNAFSNCPMLEMPAISDTVSVAKNAFAALKAKGAATHTPEEVLSALMSKNVDGLTIKDYRLIFKISPVNHKTEKCYEISGLKIPCEEICLPRGILDGKAEYISGCFTDDSTLRRVVIGDGIVQLPPAVFRRCPNLEEISVPAGFKSPRVVLTANCPKAVLVQRESATDWKKSFSVAKKNFTHSGLSERDAARVEAAVTEHGGKMQKSIGKRTDCLIMDANHFSVTAAVAEAERINANGGSILILSFDEFMELLG